MLSLLTPGFFSGAGRNILSANRHTIQSRFFSLTSARNSHLQQTLKNKNQSFFSQHLPRITKQHSNPSIFSRLYSSSYRGTEDQFCPHYSSPSISALIWTIIGLNTAVFSTWLYADRTSDSTLKAYLYDNFTLKNDDLSSGRYHTLLTSAFSHMEPVHFVFNMVSLNAFGSVIKRVYGVTVLHVMGLVIGSALASSAAFLYHSAPSNTPKKLLSSWNWKSRIREIKVALGASGVVMGLAATATCLAPTARMGIFPIPFGIPLFVLAPLYVGVDMYFLNSGETRTGHAAHLGGFAFGTVFYLAYLMRFGGVWRMITRWR